jgi:hypothetical protein
MTTVLADVNATPPRGPDTATPALITMFNLMAMMNKGFDDAREETKQVSAALLGPINAVTLKNKQLLRTINLTRSSYIDNKADSVDLACLEKRADTMADTILQSLQDDLTPEIAHLEKRVNTRWQTPFYNHSGMT